MADTTDKVRILCTDLRCLNNDDEIGLFEADEAYVRYASQREGQQAVIKQWPRSKAREGIDDGDKVISSKKPLELLECPFGIRGQAAVSMVVMEQDQKYVVKLSGPLEDPEFSLPDPETLRNLFAGKDDFIGGFSIQLSLREGVLVKQVKAGKWTNVLKIADDGKTVKLQMYHNEDLNNVVEYRASVRVEWRGEAVKWTRQSKKVAV